MPPFLILHGHSDEIVRNDSLLSPARFLLRLFAQWDQRIFEVALHLKTLIVILLFIYVLVKKG